MPKTNATPPQDAPEEDLEATEVRPERPRKAKLRTRSHASELGHFGAPPKGATHWGVRRFMPDGSLERVGGPSADGQLRVNEWPLEELDESIAKRLPPGRYRLEWIGNGKKGSRTFLAWGREFEVPGASASIGSPATSSAASSSSASNGGSPLEAITYMREMRALAREELETIESQVNGRIGALAQLAAVMRPAAPAESPELVRAIGAIGTVLERLEARVASLETDEGEEEDDDDDDEEEDEEEEEGGDAARFKPPTDSHADVAIAATLNKLEQLLSAIAPSAGEFAAAALSEKAAAIRARSEATQRAESTAPHALNGAAPPASSPPTETAEAAG
jgi:hypothetical protein